MAIRFEVFGTLVRVEQRADGWRPYFGGEDGKKRIADFVIPHDLAEDELREYLADLAHLAHEYARPGNVDVVRLD